MLLYFLYKYILISYTYIILNVYINRYAHTCPYGQIYTQATSSLDIHKLLLLESSETYAPQTACRKAAFPHTNQSQTNNPTPLQNNRIVVNTLLNPKSPNLQINPHDTQAFVDTFCTMLNPNDITLHLIWLVVSTPLKNISHQSLGMLIPNISNKKSKHFQTTNQLIMFSKIFRVPSHTSASLLSRRASSCPCPLHPRLQLPGEPETAETKRN